MEDKEYEFWIDVQGHFSDLEINCMPENLWQKFRFTKYYNWLAKNQKLDQLTLFKINFKIPWWWIPSREWYIQYRQNKKWIADVRKWCPYPDHPINSIQIQPTSTKLIPVERQMDQSIYQDFRKVYVSYKRQ
jgi:hypothetical protein